MSGAPVSDVKKKLISLCLKCFFFLLVQNRILLSNCLTKEQLIGMVAKTGAERSIRSIGNGHLFRFLHFCSPGTFGKNTFLLW